MRLGPLPADFQFTRDQLHQVAFYALAPARYKVEERMGLRSTAGGFGTPEFDGRVARVEGNLLVHEQGGNVATQPITTIRTAVEFFGNDYEEEWFTDFRDPLPAMDPDGPLRIEETPARALGEWFQFGFAVLEELRVQGTEEEKEALEAQLWPEHFDAAVELGIEQGGKRATYGASPGDTGHLEPYLYVSAWSDIDRSNVYWNDRHFNGSSLPFTRLLETEDQMGLAHEFFLEGHRILHS